MSIATEIQRLQQAKADIKTAIENKGVTVGDGTIDTFASKISEITGGGGSGGIPTGYHSITFMNGDDVLFKRLVLNGDDCSDPLTQGRIETPTKESTPQYNYTHSGWTSVDGGTANSSVLKNITEDKVVYSAYTESTRYYTVNFYDGDTLIKTEQMAYGSMLTTPTKEGYVIESVTPELAPVTADISYMVVYREKTVDFASATWADIASVCEGGLASKNFNIGDTRKEAINGKNYTLEIIGIDHDTEYDTGKTVGITVWVRDYDTQVGRSTLVPWNTSNLHTAEEAVFELLSSELQNVVKSVSKAYTGFGPSYKTTSAKIWSLSAAEINACGQSKYAGNTVKDEGTPYAKFPTPKEFNAEEYEEISLGVYYWLRSTGPKAYNGAVQPGGKIYDTDYLMARFNLIPCFCI